MTWQALILVVFLVSAGLLIGPIRTITFNILATAIILLTGTLQRLSIAVPGWLANAGAWATRVAQRAGRIMRAFLWILIAATLLMLIGSRTGQTWLVYVPLTLMGLLFWFLHGLLQLANGILTPFGRIVQKIAARTGIDPNDMSIDTGLTKTLLTMAWSSVFLAIVLLATNGGMGLSGKAIGAIVLLGLLFAMIGTASEKTIKFAPWLATAIVALVVLPELLQWQNPAMDALGESLREHKLVAVYQLADQIEPDAPVDLTAKHRVTRRRFVTNEIKRFVAECDRLAAISDQRSLTPEEMAAYDAAYTKVITLQQELKSLNQRRASRNPVSLPLNKPPSGSAWYWYAIPLVGLLIGGSHILKQFGDGFLSRTWKIAIIAVMVVGSVYLGVATLDALGMNQAIASTVSQRMLLPQFSSQPLPTALSLPPIAGSVAPAGFPYIEQAGTANGLSRDLIQLMKAICIHESGCTLAMPRGASGEYCDMQIMPDAAASQGVTDPDLLNKPETCFDVGAKILRAHAMTYGPNRLWLVALAYNGVALADRFRTARSFAEIPPDQLRGVNSRGVPYDAGKFVTDLFGTNLPTP